MIEDPASPGVRPRCITLLRTWARSQGQRIPKSLTWLRQDSRPKHDPELEWQQDHDPDKIMSTDHGHWSRRKAA